MSTASHSVLLALILLVTLAGCQMRGYGKHEAQPTLPVLEHVVAAGETLSTIAADYGVTTAVIIDANDLRHRRLAPGQLLKIPGGQRPAAIVPSEPVPVVTAKPPGPSSDWFIPRSAWARDQIVMDRIKPMGGTPTRITVHHSGEAKDIDFDPREWLRLVEHQHIEGTGHAEPWACIGYHFIIGTDGQVYEGRPLRFQGAHAGNDEANRQNIGICVVGNFELRQVPEIQRRKLIETLDRLSDDYHINRTQVFGHKHWKVTDCPGRFLSRIIDAYAVREHPAVDPFDQDPAAEASSRLSILLPAERR